MKLFVAAIVWARVGRLRRVVAQQVVVRAGEGGEIRRRLLVAPLGIGSAAVDREADDPDDRDHGQDEDNEDLAALIARRTPNPTHVGPRIVAAAPPVAAVGNPTLGRRETQR